jgi:hypothetical protein
MIFIGSLTFSLSDVYNEKWLSLFIQIMVSGLYFCIYRIQNGTYLLKLEEEKR